MMNENKHINQELEKMSDTLHSLSLDVRYQEIKIRIAEQVAHYSGYQPTDEEMNRLEESSGFFWLNEEFRKGKSRAEIILEFNRNRRTDPDNYYTPDGRPMTISLFKTCVSSYNDMFPDMIDESEADGDSSENLDFEFQPDSNFEFRD